MKGLRGVAWITPILVTATLALVIQGRVDGYSNLSSDMRVKCFDGVNYRLYRERSGYTSYGFGMPVYKTDGTVSTCSAPLDYRLKKGEKYAKV